MPRIHQRHWDGCCVETADDLRRRIATRYCIHTREPKNRCVRWVVTDHGEFRNVDRIVAIWMVWLDLPGDRVAEGGTMVDNKTSKNRELCFADDAHESLKALFRFEYCKSY